MTQLLASHIAGFRLARIILLLLIPIGYFGFEVSMQTARELQLARSNRSGMTLMDLTFRTMQDYAEGLNADREKKLLGEYGPGLAVAAGVGNEYDQFAKALAEDPPMPKEVLQKATALMGAVGGGVAMNDAGNREANTLADLAGFSAPKILTSYAALRDNAQASMADATMLKMKQTDLAYTASTLEFMSRELGTSTVQARAVSADPFFYSRLLQTTWWLTFEAAHFRAQLFDTTTDSATAVGKLNAGIDEDARKWFDTLDQTWTDIRARMNIIADGRARELNNWIYRTLAIALGATVLGIGTAVSMFRHTLRELDQVEHSRRAAIAARAEAERSTAELAVLNDGMGRINKEMSANLQALRAAQDQVVKKTRMEQMGQLTATIAHELRNPLGAVRTSAFLLERKTKGKDLGIEGQLQRINNGVTRCDAIITQLLDFSRSKQIVTNAQDFDHWLEQTVGEEAQRLPASVSIACNLGLGGMHVPFDASRLQRAIGNLLSNASEALVGDGDGSKRHGTGEPTITVSTRLAGEFISIEITDNGPGIKPDDMRRIREPLYTTKSFGTGLGLPAVEQIIVQHGGTLHIASEYGHGATFTIQLPAQQQIEQVA
ncbi:MAG: HAMP domain-containing histidine kinase [Alphaproteobacteria bacterium]|nr:HAMP domain-containing histidine kinase [Alphaproteobacteria bacterium]